jgi:hypothetical protein
LSKPKPKKPKTKAKAKGPKAKPAKATPAKASRSASASLAAFQVGDSVKLVSDSPPASRGDCGAVIAATGGMLSVNITKNADCSDRAPVVIGPLPASRFQICNC